MDGVSTGASVDLILTKMARDDDDDLQDIQFLLRQESLSPAQLKTAFRCSRVPDVPEIQELFYRAQPKVLALARAKSHSSSVREE